MSKLNVYVVEDKKSGFNSALLMHENDAIATRNFANAVKQPGTLLHTNPEDFYLWKIACYDTKDNILDVMDTAVVVAKAISYSDKKVEVNDEF